MITIEQKAFDIFLTQFANGKFRSQRLGQAFYNHFRLDKLSNQEQLNNIWAKDGEHALNSIKAMVIFS